MCLLRTSVGVVMIVAAMGGVTTYAQREIRQRHVLVTVSGRNNAPVRDLTAADFTIREDNIAREVISVGPAAPPTHLALLVDDSQASVPLIADLRAGLSVFIDQFAALPDRPAMSVTTFGERPTRQLDFTTSASVLSGTVQKIVPRTGSGAYLLDAILDTCKDLKAKGAAQPAIVVFLVEAGAEFSNRTQKNVSDALKDAHASLWVVVLHGGRPGETDEARERALVVGDSTTASGGMVKDVLSKEGLATAFQGIAAAITSRYDVVYGRPDSLIPPSRLDVQVRDRSLRVIAPRWTGQ